MDLAQLTWKIWVDEGGFPISFSGGLKISYVF